MNKNIIECGTIFKTSNYSQFNNMAGNREVKQSRVNKIKKSIENIGYISAAPIIVNEKMEIIDGQGRFEACKQLSLPIYFAVEQNAGIEHCISMNINSTNWTSKDYIESYVSVGNSNYIRLKRLIDDYGEMFSLQVIVGCACDTMAVQVADVIQSGKLSLDEQGFISASESLSFLIDLRDSVEQQVDGNKAILYLAIAWVYNRYDDDTADRVVQVIKDKRFKLTPSISTIQSAFKFLEDEYNYRLTVKNHKHFFIDYQKLQTERVAWYESRYMSDGAGE